MRSKVFSALYHNRGEFVSGEALSEKLNISRAAVSKHIAALKADGAVIESVSHKGHCMTALPDRMKDCYVLPLLKNKNRISDFIWVDTTDSTNIALKKIGEQKDEITVLTCEDQPGGIGRRGRSWASSRHNGIYVSFLVKPDIPPSDAFQITCLAAVAQVKAIEETTGLRAKIKWPNDIVSHQKKLSGTLTEMSSDFDGIRFIVCGIGINVNQGSSFFTGEIASKATSLKIETGRSIERLELFAAFIDAFIGYYDQFKLTGADAFMDVYRSGSAVVGQEVNITSGNQILSGMVIDIDKSGALLLDTGKETQRVLAGEVSLRGKDGYV